MARTSTLAFALLAAAVAVQTGTHAQNTPQPAVQDTGTVAPDSRAVRLDAIVTDQQGRPVLNLKPADFQIVENGVAQRVESAVLTSKGSSSAAIGPVNVQRSVEGTQGSADEAAGSREEERAAKEPGARVVAIYLDEFHVSAGDSSERVREAVTQFIDRDLRPGDLAAVMKPLDHLTSIRFTKDRDSLRKTASTFEGRKGDYTARTRFEEQYIGRVPAAVRSARAQIVLSGLRALTTRMGELDSGLAGIVLFTEGFDTEGLHSRERRLPDLQTLVRAASRFRILLYAIDPGLPIAPAAASDTDMGVTADDEMRGALEKLARDTGGDIIARGGDVSTGLQRLSRDLDAHYVLTYRSTNASDGRFRTVQVTSTRRDARVRARSGYWAPLPPELRLTRSISQPLALSMMRPLRRSPLIQSWFGTTVQQDGSRRAIFTWMPARTVSPAAKVSGRAEVVALKVTTPAGKVLFEGDVSPAQPGSSGSQRADSAMFDTSPGRLQFDLTILRADGSKLDVGMEDFDIPELKDGPPVILQPQLFRASSAREFREISTDANAAPIPGRDFRRTDHLLMRVPTFSASGAKVEVGAKLMNRTGAVLHELLLLPTGDPAPPTISQFDLPLARYAPGEYALEVSAASDSGTSRQLIHFRITG